MFATGAAVAIVDDTDHYLQVSKGFAEAYSPAGEPPSWWAGRSHIEAFRLDDFPDWRGAYDRARGGVAPEGPHVRHAASGAARARRETAGGLGMTDRYRHPRRLRQRIRARLGGAPVSRYRFSSRSLQRLRTCHPDLVLLFTEALADPACPSDMTVIEGHRGEARQNEMKATGKSQLAWPRSKHNSTPSMAVDAAPYVGGSVSWDWQHYYPLAEHIKATWARLKAEGRVSGDLEWGGDWRSFKDGPHWQINR